MFYVYGLVDSSTQQCFYVGKGCGNRMYRHEQKVRRGASTGNPHLDRKIQKLIHHGIPITYTKFVDNIEDENVAYSAEDEKIREIGIQNLCNVWFGGQGGRLPSDEVRQRISENRKGIPVSAETRKRMSDAKRGTRHSEETKQKKSLALKGKPQTEAQRAANAKRSSTLKGRKKSADHVEKLRQAKLNNPVRYWAGKHLSEEHKQKIRQSVLHAQEATNDQSNG